MLLTFERRDGRDEYRARTPLGPATVQTSGWDPQGWIGVAPWTELRSFDRREDAEAYLEAAYLAALATLAEHLAAADRRATR